MNGAPCAPPVRALRMLRRGLTLLEVLIALTLLVALGAIAFPAVMGTVGERAFEAAGDQLVNQLLLARATAQETGRVVEVVYRPETGRVVARYFDPDAAPLQAGARFEDEPAAPWRAPELEEVELAGAADTRIPERWADRALPEGVRVTDRPPAGVVTPEGDGPAPPDLEQADAPEAAPLRLAIFLADGSALLAPESWLVDDDGRLARLAVRPWTGLPHLARVAAGAVAAPGRTDETGDGDAPEDFADEPWPEDSDESGAGAGPGEDAGADEIAPTEDGDAGEGGAEDRP